MRSLVRAGALLLTLGGCGDHDVPPAQHHASASCPLQTPAAWQSFRQTAASDANWVKTCSDQGDCEQSLGAFSAQVQQDVLGTLALCTADLRDNPRIDACTHNLRRFAPAWLRQHGSQSYGFEQANADYFAAQLGADMPPGMMDPPTAFIEALPSRAAVEAAAQQAGWAYLTHDSCLGGLRLFIQVPDAGDRFDQWLLLGVDANADAIAQPSVLSFLAVQKRTANGARLPQVRVHFRDYALTATDGPWRTELPEQADGKCYACHGSGVRQLLPFPSAQTAAAPVQSDPEPGDTSANPPSAFAAARLEELNQRLASYGLPNWDNAIHSDDYGPALGAELGCTHCHDGQQRGPLTVFTSQGMLYQKVVGQLSMRSFDGRHSVPDLPAMQLLQKEQQEATPLSSSEDLALARARAEHEADYAALVGSRLPALEAWLLATPCN